MSDQFFSGYSAYVWQAVYAGLAYFNDQLAAVNTASNVTSAGSLSVLSSQAEGMYSSLRNGTIAINAYAITQAWSTELNSLQAIQGLPLVLDSTTVTLFNNRVNAYAAALTQLTPLVPTVSSFGIPTVINSAASIIPSTGLLAFMLTFDEEPVPSLGFIVTESGEVITTESGEPIIVEGGFTSLVSAAYGIAQAMLNVANAISVYQGSNITQLYDVAYRQYQCAISIANLINSFTSGPLSLNYIAVNTWNQLITMPTMVLCSDVLNGAGYTLQLQQQAVLRYAMLTTADQISTLLLSLRQPLTSQVNLTRLRVNETLFDVAARALGNYELWPEIATLNGLVPPYVGMLSSPGIAGWGTQLVLPTPGTDVSAIGTLPNYNTNFLGNDLYVGPINGSMPPWTGDFQVIGGYSNLQWALGRRVQTTLSSLKYHPNYGCLIPPEVGNIQSNTEIGHINAFGISALKSDPRVASVTATTSTLIGNGAVQFVATVQPGGFQTTPVGLNEVISPTP